MFVPVQALASASTAVASLDERPRPASRPAVAPGLIEIELGNGRCWAAAGQTCCLTRFDFGRSRVTASRWSTRRTRPPTILRMLGTDRDLGPILADT